VAPGAFVRGLLFIEKRETKAVMEDSSAKTPIKMARFAVVGELDIAPLAASVSLVYKPVLGALGSQTKKAGMT